MSRLFLAGIGVGLAVCMLGSPSRPVDIAGPFTIEGQVVGHDNRPRGGLSVFLDRGDNLIERYQTDSVGGFRFPLWVRTPHRATWLVCPRGAIPIVGTPEYDEFSRGGRTVHTYVVSPATDTLHNDYRQRGWNGAIPRECPPSWDLQGWRYPASAGKDWGAYSRTEPDWDRYPGPPALPPIH